MAEFSDMAVHQLVAEQFALLQANRDRQAAIAALDADDLESAESCLTAIDHSLTWVPISDAAFKPDYLRRESHR